MSSSQNNLLHSQSLALPIATERDPEFYYDQNIVVLLVGNTLFRFQASLLAPDPDVEDYEFKPYMKDTLNPPGNTNTISRVSDGQPIALPKDISLETFRELLSLSSGGVTNNTLMEIIVTINNTSGIGHSPKFINRLSKLGYLAGRFGMRRLDSWVQTTIQTIFQKFPSRLIQEGEWSTDIILQLVQHMWMTGVEDYRSQILGGIRLVLGTLVGRATDCPDKSKDMSGYSVIRICTSLYKEKSLQTSAPGIFGFAFAVVLSLGYRSPIWVNVLTREDRRVLYAANTMLVCLCDHVDLELGWLLKPTDVGESIKDCSDCSKDVNFATWWDRGFGKCKGLNSPIPLEDIRHIAHLPYYRRLLYAASSGRCSCGKKCPARLLADIDKRMESLYCVLASKYKYLEETV